MDAATKEIFLASSTCRKRRNSYLKKWDYLKSISREITQQDGIEIGMFIGANCMKALEPMEIISSRKDGPYANRTKLGWCVTRPIVNKSNNKSVTTSL